MSLVIPMELVFSPFLVYPPFFFDCHVNLVDFLH